MVSFVIPVYNEEESLPNFFKELKEAVGKLSISYEHIFVDDGSTDDSFSILKKFENEKNVRMFSFRKNQGKAEALTLGFSKARGDYIVTLDADLQDKPTEIGKLLDKMKEGYDVVCGWRKERKDPPFKVLSSWLFNFLTRGIWRLELHDYNCGLKLYTKEAAKSLYLYGGMHRFIPLLVHQEGFMVTEISVMHDARRFGKSKYGFSKLWKDLPDIFTMIFLSRYAKRPLHFFGSIGGTLLIVGIFILIYLSALWFQGESIGRRPLLILGILLVLSGLQVLFTGFLADLITNFFHQSKLKENNFILKYSSDKE